MVLDRTNGEEIDRMWFADRSPDYRVGPLRGQVYVREGSVITARKFSQPLDVCPTEAKPAPPPTPEVPPAVVAAPPAEGQGR